MIFGAPGGRGPTITLGGLQDWHLVDLLRKLIGLIANI
jgi:hypothetical protein